MTDWSTLDVRLARGDREPIVLTPERADTLTKAITNALVAALCDSPNDWVFIDSINLIGAKEPS